MDVETFLTVPISCRRTTVSKLCVITNKDMFSNILDEFKDITTPRVKRCRLQGKVEHHIDTRGGEPVVITGRLMQCQRVTDTQYLTCKILQ